jgi:hypothetical protein
MPDPKTPDDSPESPAEDSTDEFDKRLAKAYATSIGRSRTRTS